MMIYFIVMISPIMIIYPISGDFSYNYICFNKQIIIIELFRLFIESGENHDK